MLAVVEKTGTTVFLFLTLCLLHFLHLSTHAVRALIDCLSGIRDAIEEGLILARLRPRAIEEEMQKLKKKAGHVAVIWVPVNGLLNKLFCLNFVLINHSGREKEQIQENAEVNAMMADIERIITWAKRAGIEELSFYDERGLLKKYQYDLLESLAFTDVLSNLDSISLIPTNIDGMGVDYVDLIPAYKITYKSNDKIQTMRLNILSRRNGHEHLAQVARNLINSLSHEKNPERALNELNVKAIGREICSTSIGPPDLLMVLGGRSLRFRGFPPWQLSLSEIYHGRSYSIWPYRLTYREFSTAMRIFSDCEQRKGT